MKLFDYMKIGISAVILFFLVRFMIGKDIIGILKSINLFYLLGAILFFVITLVLDLFRIYLCLNFKQKSFTFKEVWDYFKPIWALSFFLPSKLGDLSWVYLMKKKKFSNKRIIWVLVLDLFFIYACFGILALAGINAFLFPLPMWLTLSAYICLLLASAYMLINFERFLIWVAAVCRVFSQLLMIYLLVLAVSSVVPSFFDVMIVNALTSATGFLPFTVSGLGAREAAYTLLFQKVGMTTEASFTIAMLNLAITYVVVFIFVLMTGKGVLDLWKKRKD